MDTLIDQDGRDHTKQVSVMQWSIMYSVYNSHNVPLLIIITHNTKGRKFVVSHLVPIILSYAFKMRQDYLSTSYLDQKYLPSERSERGRYELIQVTCAEIILSHF